MTKSIQDHAGAATDTDPNVACAYEDGNSSYEAKYVRPASVTYPGPSTRRKVYYHYTDSTVANESNWTAQEKIGQKLSRLRTIAAVGESGDTIPFIRSPRRRPFLVGRKSGENLKNLGTPY